MSGKVESTSDSRPVRSECGAARHAIARFLAGGLGKTARESLRRHAADCADCRALYRRSVNVAAQLGRSTRDERLKRERRERREVQRRMALGASEAPSNRNWRLILLPGLFALLVILVSHANRGGRAGLELTCTQGRLTSSVGDLETGGSGPRLRRGGWCRTGSVGGASLERGSTEIALGPSSEVLVEVSLGVPRVRLVIGTLAIQGEATVPTPFGIVEQSSGRASLSMRAGALRLLCHSGVLRLVGPLGVQTIAPGSDLSVGSATELAKLSSMSRTPEKR